MTFTDKYRSLPFNARLAGVLCIYALMVAVYLLAARIIAFDGFAKLAHHPGSGLQWVVLTMIALLIVSAVMMYLSKRFFDWAGVVLKCSEPEVLPED